MAIKGSLSEASLPDVLQLLSMGRKTGCLSLSQHNNFGYMYFDAGRISHASIVNRRDRIGERLVQAGVIASESLQSVIAELGTRRDVRLGDLLVARGLITRQDLHEYLRVQVEETVYLLYTWNSGTFDFEPDVRPQDQDNLVSINPESLLLEGARRVDEWTLIEKSIPSLDMVFDVDRSTIAAGTFELTAEHERILQFVDGKRDVTQIAEDSGLAEFDVGKALHELTTVGAVRAVARAPSPELETASSARIDEHRNLGIAFYRASMFDESMREMRRVLELEPADAQASAYAALVLMRQRKWNEAASAYGTLTALPTASASTHHNFGLALERLGRYNEAREAFRAAARRAGDRDPRIQTSLGAITLLLGDAAAADGTLAAARTLWTPRPSAVWYHYAALAAAWVGDLDRTQALLEEGLAYHPRAAALHNNLTALLERRGAIDAALETAERGLVEDREMPQLHKNVGDLYYRVGRHDEAQAAFERAVAVDPAHGSDVYLKLGNILLKRQQRGEAVAHWQRALELDPNNAIVRSNLNALGVPA